MYNAIIQLCTVLVAHRIFGINLGIVFNEAETARCLFEFIQTYDELSSTDGVHMVLIVFRLLQMAIVYGRLWVILK